MKNKLKLLKNLIKKVELPWTFSGNYPFNVTVNKPGPSLSKHDEHPTVWHWDDGSYLAAAVNELPSLIARIERLEAAIGKAVECHCHEDFKRHGKHAPSSVCLKLEELSQVLNEEVN